MKLQSVLISCVFLLVIATSVSAYIPVRLLAKLIPATVMYGSFYATSGISKAKLPAIRLGDHHHEAVHVYPHEHTHKLTSHSSHAIHSDHHGHHIGHHGHHGHHGIHLGLHEGGHHGLSLGGLGGGFGGLGGGFGGGFGL